MIFFKIHHCHKDEYSFDLFFNLPLIIKFTGNKKLFGSGILQIPLKETSM